MTFGSAARGSEHGCHDSGAGSRGLSATGGGDANGEFGYFRADQVESTCTLESTPLTIGVAFVGHNAAN